jgi:NAD(P)-dependent dehydrogenase (short-subunit alcohol dehydrogenase family)
MSKLTGKTITIIGATGSVGRDLVALAKDSGAHVTAVARTASALATLAADLHDITTVAADATDERAPELALASRSPDVLVLSLGARPSTGTIVEQRWDEFSRPWNVDVRASLLFCQAALRRPLAPGSAVILISSGAGLGGSPVSGGYAGAKRMQMFLAEYAQEESDRLHLGIRFIAVVPMGIMTQTPLGKAAVAAYARYRGLTEAEYVERMNASPTPRQVAEASFALAAEVPPREGNVFGVSATGIEEITS